MDALTFQDGRLRVDDVPRPTPSPRGAVVAVHYSGVSHLDLARVRDATISKMASPDVLVLGRDCVGQVVEVGSMVSPTLLGKHVAALAPHSHAEYVMVPARYLLPISSDVCPLSTSGYLLNATAVQLILSSIAPISQGTIIVVHAGAGGMGQLLISHAALAGATVIATVGADWKIPFAKRAGASTVLNYTTSAAWAVEVALELSAGRGADLILDGVGGALSRDNLLATRRMGHIVSFGHAAGLPRIGAADLIPKGLRFSTFSLGLHMQTGGHWLDCARVSVEAATTDPPLHGYISEFSFSRVVEVYERLAHRETVGKHVLRHID